MVTSPSGVEKWIFADSAVTINTWYHVAAVFGSSGMIMYINGGQQTDTDADTGGMTNTSPSFVIGSLRVGTWPFNGKIDDVRVYNRVLSADEIRLLYNLGR